MPKPPMMVCARIWLSNTKSSEFCCHGSASSRAREYARYPVWYSDRWAPISTFSKTVSSRFATYFHTGMPPLSAPPPRMREPSTMS